MLAGATLSSAAKHPADAVFDLCTAVDSTPATINHADLMLYRHCREDRGHAIALYFQGETFNYKQIADVAAGLAEWLGALGIEPGDRVALTLPDCPTLAAAYFGVVAAGATAVILDPALPAEDAFYIAQLCGARLAIVHGKLLGTLAGLRSLPGMIDVIEADLGWTRPSQLATAICRGPAPQYFVRRSRDGYAYGLLSSGSTGRPKLIVHRHQDILYGYFGFAHAVLGLSDADRVVSVAKMSTGYGIGCSLLMPFLRGASAALVAEPPSVVAMTDAIEGHRCTLLFAQPRFLVDAVSAGEVAARFRSLRLVITGGEPLADALADKWARFCGACLLDSYGNTEVGFLYISNRLDATRRGSVGKPVEGVQVEVVDESGSTVVPGQIGKLRVRGPMVISGYWNDPSRTQQSFHDGWFTTSDMFTYDEHGFYFIHGRSDHLIKLGCGDWVNPIELEKVVLEHPRVRECAVVGAPDDIGLTALKAFVVIDAIGAPGLTLAAEIGNMVRDRWPMQEYKRLGTINFTATLPKTAAGKLDRARLGPQSMTEFSYKC
jgi:acyl-coenzyme A synthetase/AMP-(fatty) acid ligase